MLVSFKLSKINSKVTKMVQIFISEGIYLFQKALKTKKYRKNNESKLVISIIE